ncbi:MAG: hypothetical protein ACP5O7_12450, partial [Phycisphaerae bacterium]
MLNPARHIYPRRVLTLVLALILVMWAGAGAALADNFAGLTVTAGQPQPTIIGPGGSYSVPFQSALQPNEPGVENLIATGQVWTITSVAYSVDDVNWTTIWTGNSPIVTLPPGSYGLYLSLSGSVGSATLSGTTSSDTPDGFYLVSVATTANYEAIVNGAEQQGQASGGGATTEPVAQITGMSVGSPATETNMVQDYPNQGDINFGVVKESTGQPTANAMATATTSPATVPVENQIKWTGGTAVSGNNADRNYSLATSQKYTIDPTLAGHDWAGHNVYLWVIWATVTIDDTGTDPADAPQFPPPPEVYNGQNLGIQYDSAKDAVDFSNCQVAQMTPSGIHNVVSGGCVMKQQRYIHVFANVTQHGYFWDTGWTADGPASGNYTPVPDSEDKVYAIDSPDLFLLGTLTQN